VSSLEGRRIVVTRSEAQSHGLCRALEEAGASVLRCPTIRIDPPESHGELDAALARLDEYRWTVCVPSCRAWSSSVALQQR
jgi:uroporphyrinogen III methyltransferase/synthase